MKLVLLVSILVSSVAAHAVNEAAVSYYHNILCVTKETFEQNSPLPTDDQSRLEQIKYTNERAYWKAFIAHIESQANFERIATLKANAVATEIRRIYNDCYIITSLLDGIEGACVQDDGVTPLDVPRAVAVCKAFNQTAEELGFIRK